MGTRRKTALWYRRGRLYVVRPQGWPRRVELSFTARESMLAWARGARMVLRQMSADPGDDAGEKSELCRPRGDLSARASARAEDERIEDVTVRNPRASERSELRRSRGESEVNRNAETRLSPQPGAGI